MCDTISLASARIGNQFQLDDYALHKLLSEQQGATGTAMTNALVGWWDPKGCPRQFSFKLTAVTPLRNGRFATPFVATAMCDDGLELDVTHTFLARTDTNMSWKHVDTTNIFAWSESLTANQANSMTRARLIAQTFIKTSRAVNKMGLNILTLDGDGSNRYAMQKVFAQENLPLPRIITCEIDPKVALSEQLLFGCESVVYTAGIPEVRSKKTVGGTQRPLIEDLIAENKLPCELDSVGCLYLDYCGCCPLRFTASKMSEQVLAALPNLMVYAVTISKRRHPNLEHTFLSFVPQAYGFRLVKTFDNNPRVLTKMFERNFALVRHVSIPGSWWKNCPKSLRRKRFHGVVVEHVTRPAKRYKALVRTERGVECVLLNADATRAYNDEALLRDA